MDLDIIPRRIFAFFAHLVPHQNFLVFIQQNRSSRLNSHLPFQPCLPAICASLGQGAKALTYRPAGYMEICPYVRLYCTSIRLEDLVLPFRFKSENYISASLLYSKPKTPELVFQRFRQG